MGCLLSCLGSLDFAPYEREIIYIYICDGFVVFLLWVIAYIFLTYNFGHYIISKPNQQGMNNKCV